MKRLLLLLSLLACSPDSAPDGRQDEDICSTPQRIALLPRELDEASGVAVSRRHPGILWVHNDSGEPVLFALDTLGKLRGRVRITNIANTDWEDIAVGDCNGQSCLYIGATGDNLHDRSDRAIHRLPEPPLGDSIAEAVQTMPYTMSEPEDIEAFFVVGQDIHLLSKGRKGPITMYAFPDSATRSSQLESMQALTEGLVQLPDMVTAAAATPDGRYIVVRTYSALQIYTFENRKLKPLLPKSVDLQPLREFQGEGVDITADGTIYLVSERGLSENAPPLSKVTCNLSAG